MAEIIGVVTDVARALFPQQLQGTVGFNAVSYFKIGEGGWIDPGGGKVPRTPDATLTDLDAIIDAGRVPSAQRYSADSRAVFQKAFVGSDLVYIAPTTLRCRCFLDFGEFNDDGFGNSPELWEIALYDAADNMLVYGTFPLQLKDITKQLEDFIRIIF